MLNREPFYNYKSVSVCDTKTITFNNVEITIWVDNDGVQWLDLQDIQYACGYQPFYHSMNGVEYLKPSMYNMVYRITDDITSVCRVVMCKYLVISVDSLSEILDTFKINTRHIVKMRALVDIIKTTDCQNNNLLEPQRYTADTLNEYVKLRMQHLQEAKHNIDIELKYLSKLL